MKKKSILILSLVLLLALCLCGCGKPKGPQYIMLDNSRYPDNAEEIAAILTEEQLALLDQFPNLRRLDLSGSTCYDAILAWAQAHPQVEVNYSVTLPGGHTVDRNTESLDLSKLSAEEVRSVLMLRRHLPKLQSVDLGSEREGLTLADARQFLENEQDLELAFRFPLFGTECSIHEESLDLSRLTASQVGQAALCLSAMPDLRTVELGSDTRTNHLSWDEIAQLQAAAPDAVFRYTFTLYDESHNLSDTVLDLNHTPIYDEGAQVLRVARCMKQLETLDMDFCGVSNERMAQIRDALPGVDVIWRIWFGTGYSVRTDVVKILASKPSEGGLLDDEQVQVLQYCTKCKYLDLGHNETLTDLSFIRCMQDLEVLIVAMNPLGDLSPLAACPHLEYIEMFYSNITDLSPLSELHELRHLNIGMCDYLTSIEPLYGLTELERLYIGCLTPIPKEQIARMHELAPKCEIDSVSSDTSLGDWRYKQTDKLSPEVRAWYQKQDYYVENLTPRFALLRQQFGYDELAYSFIWLDPKYNGT